MTHKPAGGPKSRQVTQKPVRTGNPNRAVRPGFAGQIGTSIGTHVTERRRETDYRGERMKGGAAIASKLGNQVAAETTCGVGGSRTIYKSGGQGGLQTRQMPKGRSFDQKG
jgi:hypothetical protein